MAALTVDEKVLEWENYSAESMVEQTDRSMAAKMVVTSVALTAGD